MEFGAIFAECSKKHNPSRVIIIIDGVSRLVSEGNRWCSTLAPYGLPPCVRFILSTVEMDRMPRGRQEVSLHRSLGIDRRTALYCALSP